MATFALGMSTIRAAVLSGRSTPSTASLALRAARSTRSLYVKVQDNPATALERLQTKSDREGIERILKSRETYMKPHLKRQKQARDAVYNRAKRERVKLVEELALDKSLVPF